MQKPFEDATFGLGIGELSGGEPPTRSPGDYQRPRVREPTRGRAAAREMSIAAPSERS